MGHTYSDFRGLKTVGDLKKVLEEIDDDLEITIDLNPTSYDLDNMDEFPFFNLSVIGYGPGGSLSLSHVEISSWEIKEDADRLFNLSFEKNLKEFQEIQKKKEQ